VTHAPGLPRTQSLTRAITLVRAVARRPGGSSTAALARTCELPVATAARLMATLADAGFVERTPDDDGWIVGYDLVRLVRANDPHRALLTGARAGIERLVAEAGESGALAVPRPGPAMDIIAQVDAPGLLGATNWVGRTFPLHASAAGKLVLAALPDAELATWMEREPLERFTPHTLSAPGALRAELARVRARGYAELVDEHEPGLASVAAAVPGPDGRLAAIVGISGPTLRLGADRRAALLPAVLDLARQLRAYVEG
jgi:IclR family acetate operon transcriptional repressor